ncbi:MAG TPA: ROK family protein [Solirubrobacteraceae bacterium]|nr:ROK family protein [Solirubrobacteraceae bacterium]
MPVRRTIGVDIGGTKLLAGAVDRGLGVHHRTQRLLRGLDQNALVETAVDAVHEARNAAGAEVGAVGFGIPCTFDQRTGVAVNSVHLPLLNIAFADVMAERIGLPVVVDNDANAAVVAEHRAGAARGASEVVMLTLGTGIGSGLILNGKLYRGAIGAGGELGHMVIDKDGPRCGGNCPSRGCLEALASGTALAREAQRIARERPASGLARVAAEGRELAGPLVTELAHDGDPSAVEAVELIGANLGIGITNIVNIFNPQVVVIGGGVIAAGELMLEPARRVVAQRALPPGRDEVRIVAAQFGFEAGMIGAAALAFDELSAADGVAA